MKASTQEAGADLRKLVSSDASHPEDGVLLSQSPSWEVGELLSHLKALLPGKMGESYLEAHLRLSVETEVFMRRERGTEHRDQGRGL